MFIRYVTGLLLLFFFEFDYCTLVINKYPDALFKSGRNVVATPIDTHYFANCLCEAGYTNLCSSTRTRDSEFP